MIDIPAGYAECMVCDAPATRSHGFGTGKARHRIVLCGYHSEALGRHTSFAAALKAQAERKGKAA